MHGFFNAAGPTEDFRERRKPVRQKFCTCHCFWLFKWDRMSYKNCSNLFKFVPAVQVCVPSMAANRWFTLLDCFQTITIRSTFGSLHFTLLVYRSIYEEFMYEELGLWWTTSKIMYMLTPQFIANLLCSDNFGPGLPLHQLSIFIFLPCRYRYCSWRVKSTIGSYVTHILN